MRYSIVQTNFEDDYVSGKTNNPETAIKRWFAESRKNPTCVAISAVNREAACELIRWASENLDEVRKEYDKGCCYKWEFLADSIRRNAKDQCRNFHLEHDSVDPFSMG